MSVLKHNKLIKERTAIDVSDQTIRRSLNKIGVYAYAPCKKPLLSTSNIDKRKELSKIWLFKPDTFWNDVIWSDECKYNMYNSDGNKHVWREPGKGLAAEYIEPTVKFNKGNVMVWGCFSYIGKGRLVFIEDIMNSTGYVRILANNLKQSAADMGLDSFIFQQDNDPKHKSKLVQEY